MEHHDYGSAKAYAEAVRNWLTASQCWMMGQQMAMMQSLYHQQIQASSSSLQFQPINNQNEAPPLQRFGIRRWLRIDITPTQTTITQQDLDQYDKILANDVDVQTFIDLTQGLFHLEIISKLISSLFEAVCISYGIMNYPAGCTPGKYIVGIQVISCVNITTIPGSSDRVIITRNARVNFKNSLIRSMIKNMVTNFLFPLSTVFYMFPWNRSIYDLAAKTIVVHL